MERVCQLAYKIYREFFCITRHGHEGMSYITMGELDQVQIRAFSRTRTPQHRIVLSWDLLLWILVQSRIPCSFTKFITTSELSGPLYISSDIYRTQITEYSTSKPWCRSAVSELFSLCIEHLPNCYSVRSTFFRVNRDWSIRGHLQVSRALRLKSIFFLLRSESIRSKCLILRARRIDA